MRYGGSGVIFGGLGIELAPAAEAEEVQTLSVRLPKQFAAADRIDEWLTRFAFATVILSQDYAYPLAFDADDCGLTDEAHFSCVFES